MMYIIVFIEHFEADGKHILIINIFTTALSDRCSNSLHFTNKNMEAKRVKYLPDLLNAGPGIWSYLPLNLYSQSVCYSECLSGSFVVILWLIRSSALRQSDHGQRLLGAQEPHQRGPSAMHWVWTQETNGEGSWGILQERGKRFLREITREFSLQYTVSQHLGT